MEEFTLTDGKKEVKVLVDGDEITFELIKGFPVTSVCLILSCVFLFSINLIKESNSNLNKLSSERVLSIVVSPPLKTFANSLPTSIP